MILTLQTCANLSQDFIRHKHQLKTQHNISQPGQCHLSNLCGSTIANFSEAQQTYKEICAYLDHLKNKNQTKAVTQTRQTV